MLGKITGVNHTYFVVQSTTFVVTLTVVDDDGAESIAGKEVRVTL